MFVQSVMGVICALLLTANALGQVVVGLRTDNSGLAPMFVNSGANVTLYFDAINSGSSTPHIDGIEVKIGSATTWTFVPMPFPLAPQARRRVEYVFPAPVVGCVTTTTPHSIAYRLKYNGFWTDGGGSNSGLVNVPTPAAISTQPVSRAVCDQSAVNFSVGASGTSALIVWHWRRNAAAPWTQVVEGFNTEASTALQVFAAEGATQSTLRLYASPGVTLVPSLEFRATVSNMCRTVISNVGTLTRLTTPTIGIQPEVADLCSGPAVFSAAAASLSTFVYQWQVEAAPGEWLSLFTTPLGLPGGGAVSADAPNAVTTGIMVTGRTTPVNLRCLAVNGCGSVASNVAVLTPGAQVELVQQPSNLYACRNVDSTVSVVATGSSPSYRWQREALPLGSGTWVDLNEGVLTDDVGPIAAFTGVDESSMQVGLLRFDGVPWRVRCRLSNSCGDEESAAGTIHNCPADLDCSGGIDIQDLLGFLAAFQAGSADADIDDGQRNGVSNGGVDVSDLLFFLTRFEAGC